MRDLRDHGDFGLGTFVGLDGEMVVDRGTVFQVPFSGTARVAPNSWETPFA
ncbi:MAG: acetolactate decarboxylase, partial [Actinobacteria bacterium]|nr:acetolactate decarboxylase [Actinomycetota bacterium]